MLKMSKFDDLLIYIKNNERRIQQEIILSGKSNQTIVEL